MNLKWLMAFALLFVLASVRAEDGQLTGYDEDALPEAETQQAAPAEWHFLAGTGPAWLPHYEGASAYSMRVVPLFQASNGNFFAGTLGGIGYYLQKSRELRYGIRVGAAPGRNENVDAHLAGSGDLKPAGEAGFFVKGKLEHLYGLAKFSGGPRGSRAELGGGYDFRDGMRDAFRLGITVNFASQNYMQSYFGVTAEQSAASGLPIYDAEGGVRSYGLVAGWSHIFNRNWLGNLAASGKQLAGSATNSPLVQSVSSYALSYVVIYLF